MSSKPKKKTNQSNDTEVYFFIFLEGLMRQYMTLSGFIGCVPFG